MPHPAGTKDQDGDVDGAVTVAAAPSKAATVEEAIGRQVRLLRQRLGLSAAALSASAGLSAGMLSKIESGRVSASLTSLKAIAGSLNTSLSALFAATDEKSDASFVRAGEGVRIRRRGTRAGHSYELLGHQITGGDLVLEPYLIRLEEGAQPYTGFQHAGLELIYMLSGEVTYRHADRSYPMRAGDTLLFDASGVHGPETLDSLPASYLSIIVYSSA